MASCDASDLVCRLDALGPDERRQRSRLAELVMSRFAEVRETQDGYAAQLPAAPAFIRDVTEWILLERRCCPFLRFALVFEPSGESMWLELGGHAGVKAFLAAAGLHARPA